MQLKTNSEDCYILNYSFVSNNKPIAVKFTTATDLDLFMYQLVSHTASLLNDFSAYAVQSGVKKDLSSSKMFHRWKLMHASFSNLTAA